MGNAFRSRTNTESTTVHPHVHGERGAWIDFVFSSGGSSPRTWGTLKHGSSRSGSLRFIPTYMGNALSQSRTTTSPPVHPHVHGERALPLGAVLYVFGSSPRTWGTLRRGNAQRPADRFIPTYMGNAPRMRPLGRFLTVHPHVHGERHWITNSAGHVAGSSPRTWGTHLCVLSPQAERRFIPTYMGNALYFVESGSPISVHPHVHGERPRQINAVRGDTGSSPRTWGTHRIDRSGRFGLRFIPTYMGNACSIVAVRPGITVHPHVHGERSLPWGRVDLVVGSSPRTWGTQGRSGVEAGPDRFIPTYMGNAGGENQT